MPSTQKIGRKRSLKPGLSRPLPRRRWESRGSSRPQPSGDTRPPAPRAPSLSQPLSCRPEAGPCRSAVPRGASRAALRTESCQKDTGPQARASRGPGQGVRGSGEVPRRCALTCGGGTASGRLPLHRSEDDPRPLSRGHLPSVLSPPPRLVPVALLGPFIQGWPEWALDANFPAGQRNEPLPRSREEGAWGAGGGLPGRG